MYTLTYTLTNFSIPSMSFFLLFFIKGEGPRIESSIGFVLVMVTNYLSILSYLLLSVTPCGPEGWGWVWTSRSCTQKRRQGGGGGSERVGNVLTRDATQRTTSPHSPVECDSVPCRWGSWSSVCIVMWRVDRVGLQCGTQVDWRGRKTGYTTRDEMVSVPRRYNPCIPCKTCVAVVRRGFL